VDAKQDLVLIDTNIFVIDLRYKRDAHYKTNQTFLDYIAKKKTGFTTIINLLELCGILSFNLSEKQLNELWVYFQDRYRVTVKWTPLSRHKFTRNKVEFFPVLPIYYPSPLS